MYNEACEDVANRRTSPNVSHLTADHRASIDSELEFVKVYLAKVETDLAAKTKFEDPGYNMPQIERTINTMSTKITAIFKTPVPKPDPVEEPKPEAEAATPEAAAATEPAAEDAEMKPEGTAEAAAAEETVGAADLD